MFQMLTRALAVSGSSALDYENFHAKGYQFLMYPLKSLLLIR